MLMKPELRSTLSSSLELGAATPDSESFLTSCTISSPSIFDTSTGAFDTLPAPPCLSFPRPPIPSFPRSELSHPRTTIQRASRPTQRSAGDPSLPRHASTNPFKYPPVGSGTSRSSSNREHSVESSAPGQHSLQSMLSALISNISANIWRSNLWRSPMLHALLVLTGNLYTAARALKTDPLASATGFCLAIGTFFNTIYTRPPPKMREEEHTKSAPVMETPSMTTSAATQESQVLPVAEPIEPNTRASPLLDPPRSPTPPCTTNTNNSITFIGVRQVTMNDGSSFASSSSCASSHGFVINLGAYGDQNLLHAIEVLAQIGSSESCSQRLIYRYGQRGDAALKATSESGDVRVEFNVYFYPFFYQNARDIRV
ncbi:hypothetical protein GYMLUDRAFT_46692 [Collybiopsis luxurians FD-317 M1]|uniref:Unplaced genomic scaffold GYMLUscaffold_45, whole genome shotgun sequence n=1 Tax=Collybiopsis luxurians FD-317 M1 TaxID=944289 RepID=A0A0D0C3V1_9AGAR|nr:hypothetical protein GYMLUDRAFT_46692 [Collybiopsis luxurians FD-317 M1]